MTSEQGKPAGWIWMFNVRNPSNLIPLLYHTSLIYCSFVSNPQKSCYELLLSTYLVDYCTRTTQEKLEQHISYSWDLSFTLDSNWQNNLYTRPIEQLLWSFPSHHTIALGWWSCPGVKLIMLYMGLVVRVFSQLVTVSKVKNGLSITMFKPRWRRSPLKGQGVNMTEQATKSGSNCGKGGGGVNPDPNLCSRHQLQLRLLSISEVGWLSLTWFVWLTSAQAVS